jgi:hypothetical protein
MQEDIKNNLRVRSLKVPGSNPGPATISNEGDTGNRSPISFIPCPPEDHRRADLPDWLTAKWKRAVPVSRLTESETIPAPGAVQ